MSTEQERVAELQAAFFEYVDSAKNEQFQAGRIASMLSKHFEKYLGLEGVLGHYRYEPEHDAKYDRYTPVTDAFSAVGKMDDGRWGYALSLNFERFPNAKPMVNVRWIMHIDTRTVPYQIEVGLSGSVLPLETKNDHFQPQSIVEHMFNALKDAFKAGARGEDVSRRMGFL